MASAAWAVSATKAGGIPVGVEKRGQHKVTVIKNVVQPQLLASAIQKALGAGGSVDAAGHVEVQRRARSHCRFVRPHSHFIPDYSTYSVPLFLKRQRDRTL